MSKLTRMAGGVMAAALVSITVASSAQAQLPESMRNYQLAARRASGDVVGPMFNGWIKNEDGSVTMIFGFVNRNREEIVDIPLGANNHLEPAQFDGVQPTHFPVYERGGFVGLQERGVFAVTVPADMAGTEVVWTLNHGGHNYSVPGRATSPAYEMSNAIAAMGSLNPAIRFKKDGPESISREGIYAAPVTAKVGQPVNLMAYVKDRGDRRGYDVKMQFFPVGTEWILHQGPVGAKVEFDNPMVTGRERGETDKQSMSGSGDWTETSTKATFSEPGDYVVRLRVDNFMAPDSQFDNQCCWSNAYVPVKVTN
ncbi:MAG: hypothetical protein H7A05_03385 [Pseudomonadales bacterium]|nr:hypothetical protein [Pseudomonadales bacterium]MCP5343640.1 hypothetical protein [Pseudomonadales bacterium]